MYIYVCKTGDTLPRLDRRFGLPPGTLRRLNALSDPRRLVPGLTLLLPGGRASAESAMELWALPAAGAAVSTLEALCDYSSFTVLPALTTESMDSTKQAGDDPLLKAAELGGALPLLSVSNLSPSGDYSGLSAHRLLSDSQAAEGLITKASELCENRGMRGICLDFQYLPPFDQKWWETFYAMAAEHLHKAGLLLAVSLLGAEDERQEKSLPLAGQDIFAAARYADRLLLRTDTVSPLPEYGRLKKLLERWEALGLPMFKSVLCISCCTLSRLSNSPEAGGVRLPMALGGDMACALGRSLSYDSDSGCVGFEYSEPGGAVRSASFADLRGLERILALVRKYEMAGLGLWGAENISPAGLRLCASRLKAEKLF